MSLKLGSAKRCKNGNEGAARLVSIHMGALIRESGPALPGEMRLWHVLRRTGERINYVKNEFDMTSPNGKGLLPVPQEEAQQIKHYQNLAY